MNALSIILEKIFIYIQAINVNAFWCVYYFLANNVFAIAGIALFIFLIVMDIKIQSHAYLDDKRNIY
jgi:hypothetical protein